MRKIASIMAIVCFAYFLANAQTSKINSPAPKEKIICNPAPGNKGVSCYNTIYATNFKVCKSEEGYYICSQVPDPYNSTFLQFSGVAEFEEEPMNNHIVQPVKAAPIDFTKVPMSQSYINTPAGSH